MRPIIKRVAAAAFAVLAAAGYSASSSDVPVALERAALTAGLMVLTPEMEGTRLEAYPDSGGVWTICTGYTHGVQPGDVATPDECDAYLRSSLRESVDFVLKRAPPVSLLCRIAIADMHYNAGPGAVRRSTLLRLAESGDQAGAAYQFMRWVYVGGRDCRDPASNCPGIVTRREIQRDLCLVGL